MTFIAQQRLFAKSARIRKNRRKKTEKFCTTGEIIILTETLLIHSSALPCNKSFTRNDNFVFFSVKFRYYAQKYVPACGNSALISNTINHTSRTNSTSPDFQDDIMSKILTYRD